MRRSLVVAILVLTVGLFGRLVHASDVSPMEMAAKYLLKAAPTLQPMVRKI